MKNFILAICVLFILFISVGCNNYNETNITPKTKVLEENNRISQTNKTSVYNSENLKGARSGYIQGRWFTISEDEQYCTKFLCFANDDCHNVIPDKIKVDNKTFVGFGGHHYYDIDTYKYNQNTDTYTVDMALDRDPSADFGYYSKCPYDNGNITHLIFSITYVPSKKIFNAEYKGFISSEDVPIYKNNQLVSIQNNYLNIYYDNNPNLIEELNQDLKYYNVEVPKTLDDRYKGGRYAGELIYVLRYYIATNHLT